MTDLLWDLDGLLAGAPKKTGSPTPMDCEIDPNEKLIASEKLIAEDRMVIAGFRYVKENNLYPIPDTNRMENELYVLKEFINAADNGLHEVMAEAGQQYYRELMYDAVNALLQRMGSEQQTEEQRSGRAGRADRWIRNQRMRSIK